jgi:hypothetical protein
VNSATNAGTDSANIVVASARRSAAMPPETTAGTTAEATIPAIVAASRQEVMRVRSL